MTSEVTHAADLIAAEEAEGTVGIKSNLQQEQKQEQTIMLHQHILVLLETMEESALKHPRRSDIDLDWLACDYLRGCMQTATLLRNQLLSDALFKLLVLAATDGYAAVIRQIPAVTVKSAEGAQNLSPISN